MRCIYPASLIVVFDRRGLLLLAAFPLLSPLPFPHPPTHLRLRSARCGPLSPVAALTTFPSSWLNHNFLHLEKLLFSPLLLPSLLLSHVDPWGRGYHSEGGVSLRWIFWAERWASAFPAGAPETVGHHWCRLHPLERRRDSVQRAACVSACALCWG